MKILLLFIMIRFLLGCNTSSKNKTYTFRVSPSSPYELSDAESKVPGITFERLSVGKKLYLQDCSGCHALKNPAHYSAFQWENLLQKMFVKAKIKNEKEKILIREYIMASSK